MSTVSASYGGWSSPPVHSRHPLLQAPRTVAIVSVTTRRRRPLLVLDPRAGEVVACTLRRLHCSRWRILAWTVLADTADLVVVNVEGHDVDGLVDGLLDATRPPLRNLSHRDPWDPQAFVRSVSRDADLADSLRHVLSGSVRTGLADHWTDWRWWGSSHWPRLDADFLERHPSHLLWLDALTPEPH